MKTISALINTRNEEKNIRHCLESLLWCDEIIVVDMESEDKTVEIAKQYTSKVYTHEKVLAFDVARKMALDKATSDWVLVIDADEQVPYSLQIEIRKQVNMDEADYFFLPRKSYVFGKWFSTMRLWPDYAPKLFKRDAVFFTETIHDFTHAKPDTRIRYLHAEIKNAILHYTCPSIDNFINKINHYTTIEISVQNKTLKKASLLKVIYMVVKEFISRFIVHKGYKDGLSGFFISGILAFYVFLIAFKKNEGAMDLEINVPKEYEKMKKSVLSEIKMH